MTREQAEQAVREHGGQRRRQECGQQGMAKQPPVQPGNFKQSKREQP